MTLISVIIALSASVVLLGAGYLFGVRQGREAREALRQENLEFARELTELRERSKLETQEQDATLRATIERILSPLIRKEQLTESIAQATLGEHRDLTPLLDQIAEKGEFSAVLLSSDEGLPLATNTTAPEVGPLLAISSLVLLVADRIAGHQAAAPRAFLIHDDADASTLCRIFRIRDQRLSLTAVGTGGRLTTTVLDPALAKVEAILTGSAAALDMPAS